ncbi:hypothetical protein BDN72DRAFT_906484 [Pluteus cervinus]|uniref:Uncharacterized protein n=1 Tax=Pluteus cervinus TaxID=181527 RepID=A0ACD2ZZ52_9AGAR|nr:hypothetical protein BDN72DRAFT_906484 [Pluteus cervinus]
MPKVGRYTPYPVHIAHTALRRAGKQSWSYLRRSGWESYNFNEYWDPLHPTWDTPFPFERYADLHNLAEGDVDRIITSYPPSPRYHRAITADDDRPFVSDTPYVAPLSDPNSATSTNQPATTAPTTHPTVPVITNAPQQQLQLIINPPNTSTNPNSAPPLPTVVPPLPASQPPQPGPSTQELQDDEEDIEQELEDDLRIEEELTQGDEDDDGSDPESEDEADDLPGVPQLATLFDPGSPHSPAYSDISYYEFFDDEQGVDYSELYHVLLPIYHQQLLQEEIMASNISKEFDSVPQLQVNGRNYRIWRKRVDFAVKAAKGTAYLTAEMKDTDLADKIEIHD